MSRLKYLSYFLALLAILSVTGTGAFGTITADRGTEVAVVEDTKAFLSVQPEDPTIRLNSSKETADTVTLVTIENKFGEEITSLTVSADSSEGLEIAGSSLLLDTSLGVGESETATASVDCETATNETIELFIQVTTNETTVEKSKSVHVYCE